MLILSIFLIPFLVGVLSLVIMIMEYVDHVRSNLKGDRPYGKAKLSDFERELNKIENWGHQSRNYLVLRDTNISERVYLKDSCIIFSGQSMLLGFIDYHKAQKLIRKKCRELNKKVATVDWSKKS